jgi:hypothetical protein
VTTSPRSSTRKHRSASPSRADVDHLAAQVGEVLRLERVGLVVGEGAVELEVHRDELDVEAGEHRRHRVSGHAVARIDDHRQPAAAHRHEPEQVGGVVGERVAPLDSTGGAVAGGLGGRAGLDQPLDVGETALPADRRGAGAAQLDPVVLRGVVAGGEHRPGHVEAAGGEVELVGGGEPDVDHVDAAGVESPGERAGQRRRGGAHVVAHHHTAARGQALDGGEGRADAPRDVLVELVGHETADVVGLEDRRHACGG